MVILQLLMVQAYQIRGTNPCEDPPFGSFTESCPEAETWKILACMTSEESDLSQPHIIHLDALFQVDSQSGVTIVQKT